MAKLTSNILEDAHKDLILTVTSMDIQGAKSKDPARCVFAKCAVRQLNADEALVFRTRAYIRFGNRWKRYLVSQAIVRELMIFDRGGKVEGGEFLLKKPNPSAQLGSYRGERGKKTGKGPARRVVFHRVNNVRIEGSRGILLLERLGV